MKRTGVFSIYLGIYSLLTVLGYCLDAYLGIWRQGIVGILLLAIGYLFVGKFGVDYERKQENLTERISISVSGAFMIAVAVLLGIALRLLFSNLFDGGLISHSDTSLILRILATVLLPSVCATYLSFHILPRICSVSSPLLAIFLAGLSFIPFCTEWTYIPAVLVLGVIFGICNYFHFGNVGVGIFTAYFMLMFYDTLSISIGSIDFNLSTRQVISFFIISTSISCILAYFPFRLFGKKRIDLPEFLTVIFIASIMICVGLAL